MRLISLCKHTAPGFHKLLCNLTNINAFHSLTLSFMPIFWTTNFWTISTIDIYIHSGIAELGSLEYRQTNIYEQSTKSHSDLLHGTPLNYTKYIPALSYHIILSPCSALCIWAWQKPYFCPNCILILHALCVYYKYNIS